MKALSDLPLSWERINCTQPHFLTIPLRTDKINWFSWSDTLQPFVKENKQIESNFSLNLLDVCPTGALERKIGVYPVPVWKFTPVTTTCLSC